MIDLVRLDTRKASGKLNAVLWQSSGAGSHISVVTVPMHGGVARDWSMLAETLVKQGVTTLAIEPREQGRHQDEIFFIEDIQSAVRELKVKLPEKSKKIVLVGAGVGGLGALSYASSSPQMVNIVSGLALLTPAPELHGLSARLPLQRIKDIPIHIYSSKKEAYYKDAAENFKKLCGTKCKLESFDTDGQGTNLLGSKLGPEVIQRIVEFVLR